MTEEALHWHWNNEGTDKRWRKDLTIKERNLIESWDKAYELAMEKIVQRFAEREAARRNKSASAGGGMMS